MLFKVSGFSTLNGVTKVRFANDITRVKILAKHGHTNIELFELPHEMTKPEICAYLKTTEHYANPLFTQTVDLADAKYNKAVKVTKPSLDSLRARAAEVKLAEDIASLAN